ncbi:unnamed protein product [Prorocentrum cordatum]|uniref:Uncharacterized protein n=1 Tax=Prorocentrum cordatum TaxID=2364126 RepID=A0ABN9W3V8_9DINO|nr:unnamed protein product [Polarella glacialis]
MGRREVPCEPSMVAGPTTALAGPAAARGELAVLSAGGDGSSRPAAGGGGSASPLARGVNGNAGGSSASDCGSSTRALGCQPSASSQYMGITIKTPQQTTTKERLTETPTTGTPFVTMTTNSWG